MRHCAELWPISCQSSPARSFGTWPARVDGELHATEHQFLTPLRVASRLFPRTCSMRWSQIWQWKTFGGQSKCSRPEAFQGRPQMGRRVVLVPQSADGTPRSHHDVSSSETDALDRHSCQTPRPSGESLMCRWAAAQFPRLNRIQQWRKRPCAQHSRRRYVGAQDVCVKREVHCIR